MSEFIGKCLCGEVRFRMDAVPEEAGMCHCGTCRKMNGGMPLVAIPIAPPRFDSDGSLRWRQSSAWGERGFCSQCGASLLVRLVGEDDGWMVMAGALENPPPLKIARHIFIDEKPDFYDFADDAPRITGEQWSAQVVEMLRAQKGEAYAQKAVEMMEAARAASDKATE